MDYSSEVSAPEVMAAIEWLAVCADERTEDNSVQLKEIGESAAERVNRRGINSETWMTQISSSDMHS
jgi:hypothetical protein